MQAREPGWVKVGVGGAASRVGIARRHLGCADGFTLASAVPAAKGERPLWFGEGNLAATRRDDSCAPRAVVRVTVIGPKNSALSQFNERVF